ncbi:unnamed protein product [Prunus brigantina]
MSTTQAGISSRICRPGVKSKLIAANASAAQFCSRRMCLTEQLQSALIFNLQQLMILNRGWVEVVRELRRVTAALESLSTSTVRNPESQARERPQKIPHNSASRTEPIPKFTE